MTFSNTAPITIPSSGNASPYPSTITVSGMGPLTTSLTVDLFNLTHTFPDDIGLVLVGPTGVALLLQDGAGDGTDTTNISYTLDDAGAADLPDTGAIPAATRRPAGYYTGHSFPSPGPGTAYSHPGPAGGGTATLASVFNGLNPNGDWNLFVVDFSSGDSGQFAGGWALNIEADGGTQSEAELLMRARIRHLSGNGGSTVEMRGRIQVVALRTFSLRGHIRHLESTTMSMRARLRRAFSFSMRASIQPRIRTTVAGMIYYVERTSQTHLNMLFYSSKDQGEQTMSMQARIEQSRRCRMTGHFVVAYAQGNSPLIVIRTNQTPGMVQTFAARAHVVKP